MLDDKNVMKLQHWVVMSMPLLPGCGNLKGWNRDGAMIYKLMKTRLSLVFGGNLLYKLNSHDAIMISLFMMTHTTKTFVAIHWALVLALITMASLIVKGVPRKIPLSELSELSDGTVLQPLGCWGCAFPRFCSCISDLE
jgi:hypothetical protein